MATITTSTIKARRVSGTRLPCYVFESGRDLALHVARIIASVIRERNALGQNDGEGSSR